MTSATAAEGLLGALLCGGLTACGSAARSGIAAPAPTPEPDLAQAPLYRGGGGGYHSYRLPALVTVGEWTLCFAEGREWATSGAGGMDLVLRRSPDNGATWGEVTALLTDGLNLWASPVPIFDRHTGTLWLLCNWQRAGLTSNLDMRHGDRRVFALSSADAGATWSAPRDITEQAVAPEWAFQATGPGQGIQLLSGRLVAQADFKPEGMPDRYSGMGSYCLLSDDHGATWRRSEPVPLPADAAGTNECRVAELRDGRLLITLRNDHRRTPHRRRQSYSSDGGETWSTAELTALPDQDCHAGLLSDDDGGIWFSNPASTERERLTVRRGFDWGRVTWSTGTVLWDGPAGYSDLARLPDGRIACAYEAGDSSTTERIMLARFAEGVIK